MPRQCRVGLRRCVCSGNHVGYQRCETAKTRHARQGNLSHMCLRRHHRGHQPPVSCFVCSGREGEVVKHEGMGRNCLCHSRRKARRTRGRSAALPRRGTSGASPAEICLRRTFLGSTIMTITAMKTKDGKFMACIRKNKKLMLCAKEIQHAEVNAPSVHILKREPEGNQMAFRFLHRKVFYFLKADGRNLTLDETVSPHDIQNDTDYWFEKKDEGSAEQYSLQAVVNGRYLSITHKKSIKVPVFKLEKEPGDCLFATEIY